MAKSNSLHVLQLDDRLTIRLTATEKHLIEFLARQSGMSAGRYLVMAAREQGKADLPAIRERVDRAKILALAFHNKRRRRRRPNQERLLRRFKAPFLARKHAESFERVIEFASRSMGINEFSAARFLTFFIEGVAREVAEGHVVRIPGFCVIGPWYSPKASGLDACLPRLQASAPFRDFIQWNCPARLARNKEMQAHRRRRRRRSSSILNAMAAFRRRVEAQDRDLLEAWEQWREFQP